MDFERMRWMSGWAAGCRAQSSNSATAAAADDDADADADADDDDDHAAPPDSDVATMSRAHRVTVGRACKLLLDYARLRFMQHDLGCAVTEMVVYCKEDTTVENRLLVGVFPPNDSHIASPQKM